MPAITDAVDAVIQQAHTLLGTAQPPTPDPPPTPTPPPSAPSHWDGPASTAAHHTSTTLHTKRNQLHTAHTAAITAMSTGPEIAHTARTSLTAIETAWHTDKNTFGPFANTPEGHAALLRAGNTRIAETHALVVDTATRYGHAATGVDAATEDLPNTDEHPVTPDSPDDPTHPHDHRTDKPDLDNDHDPADPTNPRDTLLAAQPTTPTRNPLTSGQMPMPPTAAPMQQMPQIPQMSAGGSPTSALSGLSSALQPLTQAATAATAGDPTSPRDKEDTDHDPSTGAKIVHNADRALGLPYIWGGGNTTGPTGGGFDCSGLSQWAVAQATDGQVLLPRTTYDQINVGRTIDPRDAQPGDLIFSNFSAPGVPEHVQIYAGDNKVIEAQQSGVPVKYSSAPTGSIVVKRVV
ncbi:C40 family peptidase [Mycobacteroides abscessus]|uniref:C40 family peptidase n=1 Tax=Mycobacteroides abscessus TaxID=36809 RepID=UPI0034E86C93